jgi:hypothetical protein
LWRTPYPRKRAYHVRSPVSFYPADPHGRRLGHSSVVDRTPSPQPTFHQSGTAVFTPVQSRLPLHRCPGMGHVISAWTAGVGTAEQADNNLVSRCVGPSRS